MTALDSAAAARRLEDIERSLGIDDCVTVRLPYRDLVMIALDATP